jgi:hypothetical protein
MEIEALSFDKNNGAFIVIVGNGYGRYVEMWNMAKRRQISKHGISIPQGEYVAEISPDGKMVATVDGIHRPPRAHPLER